MKSLIEIDHQARIASDRHTNGLDHREIVDEMLSAKAQLQTFEPSLLA